MNAPKRDFAHKVKDQSLQDAFQEGFAEGMGVVENPVTWVLEVRFEGTLLYQATYQAAIEAAQKAVTYMETPGTKITIEVRQDTPNAEEQYEELGDGIVDAEVVSDSEGEN